MRRAVLALLMTGFLSGVSCALFDRSCEEYCLSGRAMVQQNSMRWDGIEAYEADCAGLDDGSCEDCQRQWGELLENTYELSTDCYCLVPEEDRDPSLEDGPMDRSGCDVLIEQTYGGDPSELEEACQCGDGGGFLFF